MSDIILNIRLTETEVIHITDALHARVDDLNDTLTFAGDPMVQDEIAELIELLDDLREQCARQNDGWGDPDEAVICDAEARMFNAGVRAREQNKGSSRAAQRRQEQAERMMKGTATPTDPDTWPLNDPADW